jgi:hypothetical protein
MFHFSTDSRLGSKAHSASCPIDSGVKATHRVRRLWMYGVTPRVFREQFACHCPSWRDARNRPHRRVHYSRPVIQSPLTLPDQFNWPTCKPVCSFKVTAYWAFLKPGIDYTRLPREAMLVALSRKVDTMMPRANLTRVEPNRSGSLSRSKFSVLCSFSWDGLVSEEQRPSTAARGCRTSMLDTNTVNKRTSLPRKNSCGQSIQSLVRTLSLGYTNDIVEEHFSLSQNFKSFCLHVPIIPFSSLLF